MHNDIIDNRTERIVDHLNRLLSASNSARFALGYLFVPGLAGVAGELDGLKELRLLIGNTTTRDTVEQLAEVFRRVEPVAEVLEAQAYPKRSEAKQMILETGRSIGCALALMDQTDEGEAVVRTLLRMIQDKRLDARVYTRGRMHTKAYIFDHDQSKGGRAGNAEVAIVGSSNATLVGAAHSTELNVIVRGADNHAALVRWFDELWGESQECNDTLLQEIKHSWLSEAARPYDVYMKSLYTFVKDRLEGEEDKEILWADEITNQLADFQKVAVRQAVQMIRDYGGAFVADVVGLGKSYVGAAVVKHFERTEHARPLVVCPAPLVEMWERYNEVYQLNARVLSMGYLRENNEGSAGTLLQDVKYRDRDFVLVDESHNLRHSDTQRYKVLQSFLATGRRCCFLTATPRNKSAWDVYHQLKLFHQDDKTDLPVDPPDLKEQFRLIETGARKLPDLLAHILVRRTRSHILRWYGFDAKTHQPVDPSQFEEYKDGGRRAYVMVAGRRQFFPKRDLATIEYSIEDTYQGLYNDLRGYLGTSRRARSRSPLDNELIYARYGLWNYVADHKKEREPYTSLHRAGANLHGLIRVLLFKRFESSVYAFTETVRRLLRVHESFVQALGAGIVPAGDEAQSLLYESEWADEADLLLALREVSHRYDIADFDADRLCRDIDHDIEVLKRILTLVEPITPAQDSKLQTLMRRMTEEPLKSGKRLVFTQYADTARYIFDNLNPGGRSSDIDVIYGGDKSKARAVGRFAPKANPEYRLQGGDTEVMTLVATDVLAEGLNLQDCDKIINYDLHWNPVRLIQRFGRIDRIGSEHDCVYGFNFLPETGIERNLGLRQKLHNRIQEIHDTIGEDSAILDPTERLNEEAMYAIYERRGGQLSTFEEDEGDFVGLNEAEEMLRQLQRDNPSEYRRIAELRDGIRAAKPSETKGVYVLCQAGRYQRAFLVGQDGAIVSRDTPRILGAVKCGPEVRGSALPGAHNAVVMAVKRGFAAEVRNRDAEREHTGSLTQGQRYVLRELRVLLDLVEEDDIKVQISTLDKAFRGAVTIAVSRELSRLRRNGVAGQNLFRAISDLYHQHQMRDWQERCDAEVRRRPIPLVVCSESLV